MNSVETNMHSVRTIPVVLILTVIALSPARAAGVHKWVDDEGITHYSDDAPETVETTLIDLPPPAIDEKRPNEDENDYYSISNQWQRMNRERLEREQIELERARIRAAQQTRLQTETATSDKRDGDAGNVRYVPIYAPFPHRKHPRHRNHSRSRYSHYRQPQARPTENLGSFPTQ